MAKIYCDFKYIYRSKMCAKMHTQKSEAEKEHILS